MIRLLRGKRGQASRGDVGGAPANSPLPIARRGGSVEGDRHPSAQPRDYLDEVDLACAVGQYEAWLNR